MTEGRHSRPRGPADRPDQRSAMRGRSDRESILTLTGVSMLKALFLLVLLPFAASAAELRDPQTFFNLNMGDLKAEAAEAKGEGKKAVMVMFEQEGCPGCRHMRTRVLNRKDVQDYYRANFANLSLDIWSSVPIR